MEIITLSRVTCPECGHADDLSMPTDHCQFFHECSGCGILLKAKAGTCCILCSYGDVPCPSVQQERIVRLLMTGAVGAIVAVVCCFTPVLVVLLGALGLSAITGYLDYILLPVMVISLGLIVYGWVISCHHVAKDETSKI